MIPLHTLQGLSTEQLAIITQHRDVYIWGSGPLGCSVLLSLKKSGIPVTGFLDGRISQAGTCVGNLPVLFAEQIVKDPSSFIIIANLSVRDAAVAMCQAYGKEKMVSYITHFQISRPAAAIDVSGMCTISCLSCPRGNFNGVKSGGNMSLETYIKVFDKLQSDIPNLTHIELYTWGEPFCNPQLPEIIRVTERKIPCTVSTNLQITEMISPVIQANPSQLHITVNGFKKSYEINMKGASWDIFEKNLYELALQRDRCQSKTTIRIIAYDYVANSNEINQLKQIASQLGFEVCFGHGYVNPYEHYLQYTRKCNVSEIVQSEMKKQDWDLDEMLDLAKKDRENPCLCQRIFPIINWDTSVSLCHTYFGPVIAESYLTISWPDLLTVRHSAGQCRECQENGLHRLDVDVLMRRKEKPL